MSENLVKAAVAPLCGVGLDKVFRHYFPFEIKQKDMIT